MIRVLKNFITEGEIKVLNSWCIENYTKPFFEYADMDLYYQKTRRTTRTGKNIEYPKECFDIQNRLIKKLNIKNPLYPPPFYKGIVNGIGFENGSIYSHCDPVYFDNTFTLHCNFITKKPIDGGITIIEDKKYDIDETDSLAYIVSHQNHEVTPIVGDKPRILWCFGFCILEEELQYIFK